MARGGFVDQLRSEVELTDVEAAVIGGAGVRSYAALFDMLQTFPSLGAQGLNLAKLSVAAMRQMSPQAQGAFAAGAKTPGPQHVAGAFAPAGTRSSTGIVVPFPTGQAGSGMPAVNGAIDLRLPNWPARNQGDRGTCVAFATVACSEHAAASGAVQIGLSEQFTFWAAKNDPMDRQMQLDATSLQAAASAWGQLGSCLDALWPYDCVARVNDVTHEIGTQIPSQQARQDAAGRIRGAFYTGFRAGQKGAAAMVAAELRKGRLVAVHLPVFRDPSGTVATSIWDAQLAKDYGEVQDPPMSAIAPAIGHAVCITGFVPDPSEPNGGDFIFRNSWGAGWGSKLPAPGYLGPEPGYGQVSATYVEEYLCGMLVL